MPPAETTHGNEGVDEGALAPYRDRKKYLYLSGPVQALIPFFSVLLYFRIGAIACLIPLVYSFVIVPLVDLAIGEDLENPPLSAVPGLVADTYYLRLARLGVVPVWISFISCVWLAGRHPLPLWAYIALAIGVGMNSGVGLTIGHELGHKADKLNRRFAMLANAVCGYAHFRIEHNRGHHIWVSTPEDSASARYDESVYAFSRREMWGGIKRGWADEAARLRRAGKRFFSADNEVLQGAALSLAVAAGLVAWCGWRALPFILIHHYYGWLSLTLANYVEHYGLCRARRPNGQYEPVQPYHSWNSNHLYSNIALYHLQRHSDHHANAQRPYQALRDFPDLPRLPVGYTGMFVLASVPALWRRVMNPRVLAWAGGDMAKVNRG